ncbi:MAG TPA: serine protease [Solirubrobacteraceae bacterium]|nr:serine protease [Solirubrobacteraceae bacterium]
MAHPVRLALLATVVALALAVPASAQVSTRVVGGTPVAAGDYPWQVAVLDTAGTQYCGGTLVAADWVLTASHCDVWETETVRVNSISRHSGGQVIQIAAVKHHPLSNRTSFPPPYDITMVRLEQPVAGAKPLAIVTPGDHDAFWAPGDALTVTGWGRTSEDGSGSDTLLEAQVPRVSDADCATAYGAGFGSADMVCAGTGGKDTCQGDSGGPLAAPIVASPSKSDPDDWRLAGVTSWGTGCARPESPGVYARLGNPVLRDWTSTTPPVAATPVLSGGSNVGDTVTCSRGSWTGGSAYFTYRFFRGAALVRASTANTYTLSATDAGSAVSCRVRGDNAAATVDSGFSNAATVIARTVPVNVQRPTVTGETVVGRELRCEPGTWNDAASVTTGFRRISAAGVATPVSSGSATYVLTPDDAGSTIACFEAATNANGSAEAQSASVGPVTAPPPPVQPEPPPKIVPPPPDLTAPTAAVQHRRCLARRCAVVVVARDALPSAGVASVRGRLTYRVRTRCRVGGRVETCVRTRRITLTGRRLFGNVFRLATPKLPRGAATLRITATDNAGNAQAAATVTRLRVR